MFIEYKNGDIFNIGETDDGLLSFSSDEIDKKMFRVNK